MFQRLFGSRSKSRPAPARTVKPSLECLDERILLSANLLVNEVLVNPPGSPDTGNEFIELRAAPDPAHPGQHLAPDFNNTWVVALEGESGGMGNNSGLADRAIKLSDFVNDPANPYTGQEFIVITDSSNNDPNLVTNNDMYVIKVPSFNLENGSMSVAVLQTQANIIDSTDPMGRPATDLDTDDKGGIDSSITVGGTPFAVTLYDAVGFREDPTGNPQDQVYGFNVTPPPDADGHVADPDIMLRDAAFTTAFSDYNGTDAYNVDAWYAAELSDGTFPYTIDHLTFGSASPGRTPPSAGTPGAANN